MPDGLWFSLTRRFAFAVFLSIPEQLGFIPCLLCPLSITLLLTGSLRSVTFSFSLIFQVDNSTVFHNLKFNTKDAIA